MDIFALDKSFDTLDLVENFESFIWAERYCAYGDFVLVVPNSRKTYSTFKTGNYVWNSESKYLMCITSVNKTKNSEGQDAVRVSGKSLEAAFQDRMVLHNTSDGWRMTGVISSIIVTLVRRICVEATERSSYDKFPGLRATYSELGSPTSEFQLQNKNLYESVVEMCESDNLGFRIHFDPRDKDLEFRLYRGEDRTYDSPTHSNYPVVFSASLDNLVDSSYLRSTEDFKNVAYISHDDRTNVLITYAPGYFGVEGWDRRVMMVDANDIENPTNAELIQRGKQELAKHRYIDLFDGEAEFTKTFMYGRDYGLGDVVLLQGEDGYEAKSRVVEHIWTYDQDGLRSYPTFQSIVNE